MAVRSNPPTTQVPLLHDGAPPSLVPQGTHLGKPALPLNRVFTLIGARSRAHLHLVSPTISTSHAALVNTGRGVYVRDLASRTHTFVNGRPVRERVLHDGDDLTVGNFAFRIADGSGADLDKDSHDDRAPTSVLLVDGAEFPIPIEGRTVLIGRRPTCEISLVEDSVSTIHAIIFEADGRRFIRDLGSRTGTFVNGTAVHQQELRLDDHIRVGDTNIRYVAEAAAAEHVDGLEHLVGTAALSAAEAEAAPEQPQDAYLDGTATNPTVVVGPRTVEAPPPAVILDTPIPLAEAADADRPAAAVVASADEDEPVAPVADWRRVGGEAGPAETTEPAELDWTDLDLTPAVPLSRAGNRGGAEAGQPPVEPRRPQAPAETVARGAAAKPPVETPGKAEPRLEPAAAAGPAGAAAVDDDRAVSGLQFAPEWGRDDSTAAAASAEAPAAGAVAPDVSAPDGPTGEVPAGFDIADEDATTTPDWAEVDERQFDAAESVAGFDAEPAVAERGPIAPPPADAGAGSGPQAGEDFLLTAPPVAPSDDIELDPAAPAPAPGRAQPALVDFADDVDDVDDETDLAADAAVAEEEAVEEPEAEPAPESVSSPEPAEPRLTGLDLDRVSARDEDAEADGGQDAAPATAVPAGPGDLPELDLSGLTLEPDAAEGGADLGLDFADEPAEADAQQPVPLLDLGEAPPSSERPAIEIPEAPPEVTAAAAAPAAGARPKRKRKPPTTKKEKAKEPKSWWDRKRQGKKPETTTTTAAAGEAQPPAADGSLSDVPAIGAATAAGAAAAVPLTAQAAPQPLDDETTESPGVQVGLPPDLSGIEDFAAEAPGATSLQGLEAPDLSTAPAAEAPFDTAAADLPAFGAPDSLSDLDYGAVSTGSGLDFAGTLDGVGAAPAVGGVSPPGLAAADLGPSATSPGEVVELTEPTPESALALGLDAPDDATPWTDAGAEPAATAAVDAALSDTTVEDAVSDFGDESLAPVVEPTELTDPAAAQPHAPVAAGPPAVEPELSFDRMLDEILGPEDQDEPHAQAAPAAGDAETRVFDLDESDLPPAPAATPAPAPEVDVEVEDDTDVVAPLPSPAAAAGADAFIDENPGATAAAAAADIPAGVVFDRQDPAAMPAFEPEPPAAFDGVVDAPQQSFEPQRSLPPVGDLTAAIEDEMPAAAPQAPLGAGPQDFTAGDSVSFIPDAMDSGAAAPGDVGPADAAGLEFAPELEAHDPFEPAAPHGSAGGAGAPAAAPDGDTAAAAEYGALDLTGGAAAEGAGVDFAAETDPAPPAGLWAGEVEQDAGLDETPGYQEQPAAAPTTTAPAPPFDPAIRGELPSDPFAGMGRDQGSFLGGLPLPLPDAPALGFGPLPFAQAPAPADPTARRPAPPADDDLDAIDFSAPLDDDEPAAPPAPLARHHGHGTTPPPPARNRPPRTAPAGLVGTYEAFDMGDAAAAGGVEIPPVGGPAKPPAGKLTTAFDGLAMSPIREADVFSEVAPPDDPVFGYGSAGSAEPEIPGTGEVIGDEADVTAADAADGLVLPSDENLPEGEVDHGLTFDEGGQDDDVPTAGTAAAPHSHGGAVGPRRGSEAKDRGSAGGKDRGSRPPGYTPPPQDPQQPAPAPAKRRRWGVRFLLPLMLICAGGAAAAIWYGQQKFFPQTTVMSGSLEFDRLKELTELERQSFLHRQRRLLQAGDVATHGREILQAQYPGARLKPGFLGGADEADVKAWLAIAEGAAVPAKSNRLVLYHRGTDPAGDELRMKALLAALYTKNKQLQDAAARSDAEGQRLAAELERLKSDIEANQRDIEALRKAADTADDAQRKVQALRDERGRLWQAWGKAVATVRGLETELERAIAADGDPAGAGAPGTNPAGREPGVAAGGVEKVAPPPTAAEDAQLAQMSARLDQLVAAQKAARNANTAEADKAAKALAAALTRFDNQISTAQAELEGDGQLGEYVASAQRVQQTVSKLYASLNEQQKQDRDFLNGLKDRLRARSEAKLKEAWAGDKELIRLQEMLSVKEHHRNAANASGLTQQVKTLDAEIAKLNRDIQTRRGLVGTGFGFDREVKELQQYIDDTLRRMETQRAQNDKRMRALFEDFTQATPSVEAMAKLPADQKRLAEALQERSTEVNAARERYLASIAAADSAQPAGAKALEDELTQLQAKVDARKQQLADAAAQSLTRKQREQREENIKLVRARLTEARAAEARADEAHKATYGQLVQAENDLLKAQQAVSQVEVAEAEHEKLEQRRDEALRRAEAIQAELTRSVVPQPVRDDAVTVTAPPDPRLLWIVTACGGIVVVFSIMMWIVAHAPDDSDQTFYAMTAYAGLEADIDVPRPQLPPEFGAPIGNGNGNGSGRGRGYASASSHEDEEPVTV